MPQQGRMPGAARSRERADREDIKRILAVYYEQNVTTERFEDFDGEGGSCGGLIRKRDRICVHPIIFACFVV